MEALIGTVERAHVCGRRGYGPHKLLAIWLIKVLYVLPTWTSALQIAGDNPSLIKACSCSRRDELPSIDAVYRFLAKLRAHADWIEACVRDVQAATRELAPDYGKGAAADSTDIPAHANGQRLVSQHGPKRERFSDPDASWGHRGSISTRTGGAFYGYKPHGTVCVKTELPMAWVVRTASAAEMSQVDDWLDLTEARGFALETLVLDMGYDYAPVYNSCHARRTKLVCPLRDKRRDGHCVPICRHGRREQHWVYAGTDMKRRATKWRCPPGRCKPGSIWIPLDRFHTAVPRRTTRSRKLYAKRGVVERFWGRLKDEWGLLELRVRGIDRVAQHVNLIVLGYLLLELAKMRASP